MELHYQHPPNTTSESRYCVKAPVLYSSCWLLDVLMTSA